MFGRSVQSNRGILFFTVVACGIAASTVILWGTLGRGSLPLLLFPVCTIFLAAFSVWNYMRLHRLIQGLDQYLQTLLHQSVGSDLFEPPASPAGDVDHLTQTVLKIVKRLHASRNQALQFSSFATHELRTPLSIIRNQLESALTSQARTQELRSVVASAYDEMLRLNQTVEDLLNLGTMQAGTLKLNLKTISLFKFLNEFYDEALFLTRPKNISVVLKKGPDIFIQADILRLRQVFFNLLDNAIKNTPSGNRIRLSYDILDGKAIVRFSDTGVGIPPERLKRIFDPFYTYTQKETKVKGAGLGLALVQWIVELHQGNITVSSEVDKGTEFSICLPCEQPFEQN